MLPALEFPEPSLVLAIEPQSKGDLDKMGPALTRMLEEEPTVRLERSTTGEQTLRTMGEAHTSVIIERLKRKFGAAIVTHTPRVPYKETIRGKTQVHGRYQEADRRARDVRRRLAGARTEPRRWRRVRRAGRRRRGAQGLAGVEKGIREAAEGGVLAGYPLSDFKATLYDGSFHPVDSNEMAFKIAASMALKDGVQHAKPALLEPIMAVEIRVPEAYMGEGRPRPEWTARPCPGDGYDGSIHRSPGAHVPQAERFNYATECARWPRAAGLLDGPDHYEDVPGHIADKVIETHRK